MPTHQERHPKGTPAGGRFAATGRADAEIELGDGTPERVRQLVASFTPPDTGSCSAASKAFVTHARRRRVPAEVLSLVGGRYGSHAVAVVDGYVVDYTFDQFEPGTPLPVVAPVEEYAADWDDYGTDFMAGMVLNSWKTPDA